MTKLELSSAILQVVLGGFNGWALGALWRERLTRKKEQESFIAAVRDTEKTVRNYLKQFNLDEVPEHTLH